MKSITKRITAVILIIIFTLSVNQPAHADANLLGYKLNGGVGGWGYQNRYFYVTPSASGYTTTIQNAMDSWIYTTSRVGVSTSISWLRTSAQSSSYMDIYYGAYFAGGIIAATDFWTYSTQINPAASNWGWGRIRLNAGTYNTLSAYNQQGSTAHEMGHVFGLNETNADVNSIMCQLGSGRRVNQPQAGDLRPIQRMYP